jgi:hypothetical protein
MNSNYEKHCSLNLFIIWFQATHIYIHIYVCMYVLMKNIEIYNFNSFFFKLEKTQ